MRGQSASDHSRAASRHSQFCWLIRLRPRLYGSDLITIALYHRHTLDVPELYRWTARLAGLYPLLRAYHTFALLLHLFESGPGRKDFTRLVSHGRLDVRRKEKKRIELRERQRSLECGGSDS
jgi:hypothetical protein